MKMEHFNGFVHIYNSGQIVVTMKTLYQINLMFIIGKTQIQFQRCCWFNNIFCFNVLKMNMFIE